MCLAAPYLPHHAVLRRVKNARKGRSSSDGEAPRRVPVFGMHHPRGANPGWIVAMGDSSCLDDALAHAKVTPRQQCRSVLIQMLNFAVAERRRPGARPALFGNTQPLLEPIADEAGAVQGGTGDYQRTPRSHALAEQAR